MSNASGFPFNVSGTSGGVQLSEPLYQLQDNSYTVIWAPILFAAVIGLSLVGILVPLWEFLFTQKPASRAVSVVSLYQDGAELEHVSELSPGIKEELARLLDRPRSRTKGWRELASELGYQYEIKGSGLNGKRVSPTISLLNRWQFTNTATVENLLKSLHAIERSDCASLIESQYNLILIECLTIV